MSTRRIDVFIELDKRHLPPGEYIVLGSGILGALGIREIADIDLLVSPRLFEELKGRGWKYAEVEIEGRIRKKVYHDPYEAYQDFWYGGRTPDPKEMIARAVMIGGFPFLSLETLREIKTAMGRPKDLKDVTLINDYLNAHHGNPD